MKKLIALLSLVLFIGQGLIAQVKETKASPKTAIIKVKYRLTIDFISKGTGIDRESYSKIDEFIKNHPKKPAYEIKQKGREGETKFLLKLTELTAEEQVTFVDEVKKLIAKPEMVLITETGVTPKLAVKGATAEQVSTKCRLVISFISKGAGLDHKTHDKIKEFIENHPKKPAFVTHKWGREGEIDYCLQLKELSTKEQSVFVEEINKLITDKEMVLVSENQDYVKKGR